jgi:hypothetical protein
MAPELESREDLAKYQSGATVVENAIVLPQGPLEKRPGTKFVAVLRGAPNDIDYVTPRVKLVGHANFSDSIASMTDTTPSLAWNDTISYATPVTTGGVVSVDLDERGFGVYSHGLGKAGWQDEEPLFVYNKDGVDQAVDFDWSDSLGDSTIVTDGASIADVRWSPDGEHIYMVQECAHADNLRIHRYERDGTRLWRKDIDQSYTLTGLAIAVDENEFIYCSGGGGANKAYPIKLSPVDGSIVTTYSSPFLRGGAYYASCISNSLGKVYFGGSHSALHNPVDTVLFSLALDSDTTVTYTSDNAVTRQLCTDHNAVYAIGINGDYTNKNVTKFNATTLAVEATTNYAAAEHIWVDWSGNIAISTGAAGAIDDIYILDRDDLSEVSSHLDLGNFCDLVGSGKGRRNEYEGWPDDELVVRNESHGFSTGDKVTFQGVGGATELNGNTYTVTVMDANYFSLDGTHRDNFSTFTSGGAVLAEYETEPVWLASFNYSVDDSYVLCFGDEYIAFFETE